MHPIAGVDVVQEVRRPKHWPLWPLAHARRRFALIGVDKVGRYEKRVGVLASSFPKDREVGGVVAFESIVPVQDLTFRLRPVILVSVFRAASASQIK